MKLLCSIYKSTKKDEMYLYVEKKDKFQRVPEALLNIFGSPVHFGDLLLRPEKKLARADVVEVIAQIQEKGFFLQMPPVKEEYLLDLFKAEQGK
ncbi:MAG: YcgL domain-containing protein [Pseudomonadales bacterium]|nr:YcgL domain-containing protein [Pseudomonadales bacterium]